MSEKLPLELDKFLIGPYIVVIVPHCICTAVVYTISWNVQWCVCPLFTDFFLQQKNQHCVMRLASNDHTVLEFTKYQMRCCLCLIVKICANKAVYSDF